MRNIKVLIITLFVFFISLFTINVSANSGPSEYFGNDVYGLYPLEGNCPVEVLSEELTINFPEIENIFEESNYDADLTATYEFYNPTDNDLKVNLAFPIGQLPEYFYDSQNYSNLISSHNVTVNNNIIDRQIRYTYQGYDNFDFNSDVRYIKDEYKEYNGFNKDSKVYKYTFNIITSDDFNLIKFNLLNASNSMIVGDSYYFIEDGLYNIYLNNDNSFTIYSIGENVVFSGFKLYAYGDSFEEADMIPIDFTYQTIISEMTLVNFTDSLYQSVSNINSYDKYNCFFDYVASEGIENVSLSYLGEYYLAAWYTYSLDIKAKEKVINTVSSPIFPNVNVGYEPNVFKFTYLLSPCKEWSSFSNLTININTPYYIIDNNVGEFIETENGYTISFSDLPDGELYFEICADKNPNYESPYGGLMVILYVFICFGVIFSLAPLVLYIIIMVDSKHKNKNNPLKKYLWTELLLCIYSFLISFVSSIVSFDLQVFTIISISLIVGSFVLFIIESIKFKKAALVRLILSGIEIIGFILCLFDDKLDIMTNLLCITFGFILTITIIVTMFKKRHYKIEENSNENNYENGKYYPVGYLSMKSFTIVWVLVVLFGIATIVLGIWLSSFWTIVMLVVYFIIVFSIMIVKALIDNKYFRECNKDLDFDKLIKNVELMLANPKIHPETKNLHLINLCSYIICYDFDKLEELRKEMFYPKTEGYKFLFEGLFVNYLLSEEEFIERINRLRNKFPKKQYVNSINNFYERWMVYYRGKLDKPLDLLLPISTKNNLLNGTNLFIRIHYFYKNNDFEMARKLKDEFMSKYSNMKEVAKMLEQLDL